MRLKEIEELHNAVNAYKTKMQEYAKANDDMVQSYYNLRNIVGRAKADQFESDFKREFGLDVDRYLSEIKQPLSKKLKRQHKAMDLKKIGKKKR